MTITERNDAKPDNKKGRAVILRRFVVLLVALIGSFVGLVGVPGTAQAVTFPWGTDPSQKGYIGFCDSQGHSVTGGDISTRPFAFKAVASVSPPTAYLGRGQNAVLNMYQPRPGTQPGDWSGQQMNAASFYKDSNYPTTVLTTQDLSIHDAMAVYPPMLDGLYQFRMYYGKSNYGLYSALYPATVIQVSGNTWHVVDGGNVQCGAKADAISLEVITGVISAKSAIPPPPSPLHPQSAPASASQAGSGPASAPTASATPSVSANDGLHDPTGVPSSSAAAAAAAESAKHSSSSSSAWWIAIPILAVVGIGAGLFARNRLRSRNPDL